MYPLKVFIREPWNNREKEVKHTIPIVVHEDGFGTTLITLRNVSFVQYVLLKTVSLTTEESIGNYTITGKLSHAAGTPADNELQDITNPIDFNDVINPGDDVYLWIVVSPPDTGGTALFDSNVIHFTLNLDYVASYINPKMAHWFSFIGPAGTTSISDMSGTITGNVNPGLTGYGSIHTLNGSFSVDESQLSGHTLSPRSIISIRYSSNAENVRQCVVDMDVENDAGLTLRAGIYIEPSGALSLRVGDPGAPDVMFEAYSPQPYGRINTITYIESMENMLTSEPTILLNKESIMFQEKISTSLSPDNIERNAGGHHIKSITVGADRDGGYHLDGYVYDCIIYDDAVDANYAFMTHARLANV